MKEFVLTHKSGQKFTVGEDSEQTLLKRLRGLGLLFLPLQSSSPILLTEENVTEVSEISSTKTIS